MSSRTPYRVLVVEDEILIALDLQHTLEDAGYEVIGPHENVADSLATIATAHPDAAILDVQLDGEDVFPVAEQLKAEGVPIVFHSGHAEPAQLQERFPEARFCSKPCTPALLESELRIAIEGA
ncbi:response regulator [Sphingomicrobium astaxanthinifaciens]|uniref:response regulator n=1 Tax=Sphingomicrobium astaxanthinifaciens TaxID=1227949 RepID=UPI001FCB0263|nr:response regulator [Sphingomicrobium astaxanthinifaciens]MCJ7420940.1 response regulator [Sphingomicrobium astaxanthinifaciens]